MPDTELTKLRRARSRAHLKLKQAEAIVAGYQAKLADLEARIQAIAPDIWLPPRFYQPNPVFARNELPRLAMIVLRQADEPLAVRDIARATLAMKGVRHPDRRRWKITRVRLQQWLLKQDQRGVTVKVGSGNATRRRLV